MSLADYPEVGPVAAALLDELKRVMHPGDSAEDMALVCVAVASAFIVSAAEAAGQPDSVARRLERAQAFLESMVDFHVARGTRAAALFEALPKAAGRRFEGAANVLDFTQRRRDAEKGGGDAA